MPPDMGAGQADKQVEIAATVGAELPPDAYVFTDDPLDRPEVAGWVAMAEVGNPPR